MIYAVTATLNHEEIEKKIGKNIKSQAFSK